MKLLSQCKLLWLFLQARVRMFQPFTHLHPAKGYEHSTILYISKFVDEYNQHFRYRGINLMVTGSIYQKKVA